jgi:hypothetical protein
LTNHGDDAIDVFQEAHLAKTSLSELILDGDYDDVTKAFKGDPNVITLDKDLIVYRYWSGSDKSEAGHWVTLSPDLTPDEARKLLALPDYNLAANVTEFTIPAGTTVLFGEAAEQTTAVWAGSYATGGGLQIYLPDKTVIIK